MPRLEPESRVRRILMQSIMWIVLGATVALAALVDQAKVAALYVPLGDPVKVDGISVQLPQGWRSPRLTESGLLAMAEEPRGGRVVRVIMHPPSLVELLGINDAAQQGAEHTIGKIQIGDRAGQLKVRKVANEMEMVLEDEFSATLTLGEGRRLEIQLNVPATSLDEYSDVDVDLITRIAASVKFD